MDITPILSDTRSSQAAIGLTEKVFRALVPYFEEALTQCKKNPYRGGKRVVKLKSACHLPAESFEQLNKLLGDEKVIIIDATEQKENSTR